MPTFEQQGSRVSWKEKKEFSLSGTLNWNQFMVIGGALGALAHSKESQALSCLSFILIDQFN